MPCERRPLTVTTIEGDSKDSSCTVQNIPGNVTGYKNVSTNSEQSLMSTVAQQPVFINEADTRTCPLTASRVRCRQEHSKPCLSQLRQTSPCFNRTRRVKTMTPPLQKGTAPQTKGRDVRIDISTMCASLMMQDSQRSCKVALWRRRDREDCHSSHSSNTERLGSHGQG